LAGLMERSAIARCRIQHNRKLGEVTGVWLYLVEEGKVEHASRRHRRASISE
jgi:hypothetical protein